jgi:signal transduction histidine kinase
VGVRPRADVKSASCGYRRFVNIQGQTARPSRPRRPPLTKRLRPRHWVALDYVVAVPCAVLLFVGISRVLTPTFTGLPLVYQVTSTLLALLLAAPVALRRRGPLLALAAVTVTVMFLILIAVSASDTFSPSQVLASGPLFLAPAAYVIYLVAAQYPRRVAMLALVAELVLLALFGVAGGMKHDRGPAAAIFVALVVIICWVVGSAAGQRRAYATQLQEQAASGAVNEERLRIARELHDVVAHSMTVVAVQAGYGLHVIEGQPEKAQEALGAIQTTSREALADMRSMLGVLRNGYPGPFGINNEPGGHRASHGQPGAASAGMVNNGAAERGQAAGIGGLRFGPAGTGRGATEAAPLAPAPGLADLERLVARIANAGVRVDLRIRGDRRELPPGIDLAAFRIVQEALTNVVKHAGVAECGVTVGYEEDELTVEIVDAGEGGRVPAAAVKGTGKAGGGERPAAGLSGDGGGHGLIGMRERVSMYGGELTAGPGPERGFRVAARLPVEDGTP